MTEWLAPETLDEALRVRADREDATVLAGGTFLGILMNQGLLAPSALLSLQAVPGLDRIEVDAGGLRLGALVTHRAVERSAVVRGQWPAVALTFGHVASPRVRNQATVGGVLADADYASDPPAMLTALEARVVVRSVGGERDVPVEELIVGHYETSLAPDELIIAVVVPGGERRATYRKFRSRSHEDRPCVGVAAVRRPNALRVVVGAVAHRPQLFPELCDPDASPAEIGAAYADAIEPIGDVRGSSEYRKRVIAVEVRRALEELAV
jgi:aerobic carbon-monoxide dehydrogenase medium subunit